MSAKKYMTITGTSKTTAVRDLQDLADRHLSSYLPEAGGERITRLICSRTHRRHPLRQLHNERLVDELKAFTDGCHAAHKADKQVFEKMFLKMLTDHSQRT